MSKPTFHPQQYDLTSNKPFKDTDDYQRSFDEGLKKGIEQGKQAGLQEAEKCFRFRIIEILRKRIGAIPLALGDRLQDRLQGLNLKQLDHALANAFEVDSIKAFEEFL